MSATQSSELHDGVLVVTFDRGLAASPEAWETVSRRLAEPDVRGAVFVQKEPADRRLDLVRLRGVRTRREAEDVAREADRFVGRLRALGKPLVAALHGPVSGTDASVALACDARVVSAAHETTFAVDDVTVGLVPRHRAVVRLAELVGADEALDLATRGRRLTARDAARMGIAAAVVAPGDLVAETIRWHRSRSQHGATGRAPLSHGLLPHRRALFRRTLRATITGLHQDELAAHHVASVVAGWVEKGEEHAAEQAITAFGELVVSSTSRSVIDGRLGLLAAERALEARALDAPPLHAIAIVGEGSEAIRLAVSSARRGLSVTLVARDEARAAAVVGRVADWLGELVERREISWIDRSDAVARIEATWTDALPRPDGWRGDAWIDLAANDDPAAGSSDVRPHHLAGIPTLVAVLRRDEAPADDSIRFVAPLPVGLPDVGALELVDEPSAAMHGRLAKLEMALGAVSVVTRGHRGFFGPRVAAAYILEAQRLVVEGAPVDVVESAALDWGFRKGPFALLDAWGFSAFAACARGLEEALGERFAAPTPFACESDPAGSARTLLRRRRGEAKSPVERLLHAVAPKTDELAWEVVPGIRERLGLPPEEGTPSQAAIDEMELRLALAFVNEAARALDDGVLASDAAVDLVSVRALGFPALRGGPLRYVVGVGAREVAARLEHLRRRFGSRFEAAGWITTMAREP